MPLMTYGGSSLLVRNGAIGTTVACCCACPVGTIVSVAWYWLLLCMSCRNDRVSRLVLVS
jgi:hypothetical protein